MKVVLLQVDDWTVLYIDGEKWDENHSLSLEFVLEALAALNKAFTFESYFAEPDQDDIDAGNVYYPDKLSEVDPKLRGPIEP